MARNLDLEEQKPLFEARLALQKEDGYAPVMGEPLVPNVVDTTSQSSPRISKLLRVAVGTLAITGVLFAVAAHTVNKSVERYARSSFQRAALGDLVSFAEIPPDMKSHCPQDDVTVCFYSRGINQVHWWKFEIGDVMIFKAGIGNTMELQMENMIMNVFQHGAVHAIMITDVPPPGVPVTLQNLGAVEALKTGHMKLLYSTLDSILNFRTMGGFWIRRVDKARFPGFAGKAQQIHDWAHSQSGEPFDSKDLFPFFRMMTDNQDFIAVNGGCDARKKAYMLWKTGGGPHGWDCSTFVAWGLGYAGGINLDYGSPEGCFADDGTPLPPLNGHIENMFDGPGDILANVHIWGEQLDVVCPEGGCDNAVTR